MDTGVAIFPTHDAIAPADLARLAEERGHESLFFPEHTHIPVDLMVMGVPADARTLEAYASAGFRRALHWLPSAPRGPVERALDRYETAIAELYGA